MIVALLLALLFITLSSIYSGTETGLYSIERVRLEIRTAEGNARAKRLLQVLQHPAAALCTLLLANNVVNFGVTHFSGEVVASLIGPGTSDVTLELVNLLYVVPLLFVFGELLPKNLFLRYPGALLPIVWPVYRVTSILLTPLSRPLLALMRRLEGGQSAPVVSLLRREVLTRVLTHGDEAESLTDTERALAARVLELRGTTVRSLTIPISSSIAVMEGASRQAILEASNQGGRSRVLVLSQSRDRFLGYVNALDAAFDDDTFPTPEQIHVVPVILASQSLLEALTLMQKARRPLAQVQAEGRIIGILSSVDIVNLLLDRPKTGRGVGVLG